MLSIMYLIISQIEYENTEILISIAIICLLAAYLPVLHVALINFSL